MVTRATSKNVSRVSVSLDPNPKKQTRDTVNKMMALILGRLGCDGCGRIAYIDVHAGDPDPDFAKVGGISVDIRTR